MKYSPHTNHSVGQGDLIQKQTETETRHQQLQEDKYK